MKPRSHRLKGRWHCHFNQVWQRYSSNDGKETCQKNCYTFRVFVLLIFSFPPSLIALTLLVVLPRKTILDTRRFCLKTDDLWKRATKSTSAGTHTQLFIRWFPRKQNGFPVLFRTPFIETFILFPRETCFSKRIHVSRKNKKKSITLTFGHVVHVCRKLPAVKEVGWRADFGKHPIHLLSSRG